MLGLRVALDVYGVGVFAAGDAIFLIHRAGHHIAIATRLRIAPGDRRLRGARFQRLELRDRSAPLVLVIKGCAGMIIQQRAQSGANRCPRGATADGSAV
jgi:hypothetical protein